MNSSKIPLPQLAEISWTYHPLFVTNEGQENEISDQVTDSEPDSLHNSSDSSDNSA